MKGNIRIIIIILTMIVCMYMVKGFDIVRCERKILKCYPKSLLKCVFNFGLKKFLCPMKFYSCPLTCLGDCALDCLNITIPYKTMVVSSNHNMVSNDNMVEYYNFPYFMCQLGCVSIGCAHYSDANKTGKKAIRTCLRSCEKECKKYYTTSLVT
ncbi:hypothetical protein RND81_14G170900 [Saponaria officinalis]|uniref:Uncharacterized protein n=1 Tax=Saponaria officinalis TaxID=3572 RepID=A0AAW1GP53_SAPOF